MGKKFTVLLVFCLAMVLSFSAFAGAETNLVVTQMYDAVSLDPHGENDQASSRVRRQLYDTLVIQDGDLNIIPGLAESWEHVDEVTWEFHLRPNVYFHNGEELTAYDVKFTFDRLRDPDTAAPGSFIVGFMDKVEVVDPLTVRITTDGPFAPMLAHLSHGVTGILNQTAVEEAGEDYGTTVVVGTGAFIFDSWSAGSHITLVKNPDYWGHVAEVDKVTFRSIPEGTVRAIELETGGVDIAMGIEPIDEPRMMDNPNVNVIRTPGLGADYVGFNCEKPPFDNVLVRQAINHAIDMDLIIEVVYAGQGVRAVSPISPTVWGANPDLEGYEYDPEKARELLAEAGYADGFKTSVWTNSNPLRMQAAEIIQADLAEVGIEMEVEIMEWGPYLAETGEGKHDMFILGWTTVTGDADYGLFPLFHSSTYGPSGNRTFWSTPRLDELLSGARANSDPDERLEMYHEAQEIIAEGAPWIFMRAPINVDGARTNISGFEPHPSGDFFLNTVVKN